MTLQQTSDNHTLDAELSNIVHDDECYFKQFKQKYYRASEENTTISIFTLSTKYARTHARAHTHTHTHKHRENYFIVA